jgi:hypothetical protein
MTKDRQNLTFSQRNGLEPLPPQLKLGEVSDELRRLLDYYINLESDRHTHHGYEGSYFDPGWERATKDLHVIFLGTIRAATKTDLISGVKLLVTLYDPKILANFSILLNSLLVIQSAAVK